LTKQPSVPPRTPPKMPVLIKLIPVEDGKELPAVDEFVFPDADAERMENLEKGVEEETIKENNKIAFQKGMLKDVHDIIAFYNKLGDPKVWTRLPTNEGIKDPKPLHFKLPEAEKALFEKYVNRAVLQVTTKLYYLFVLGEIFLEMGIPGIASSIGQFIASELENLTRDAMAKALNITKYRKFASAQEEKEFLENIPSLADVERAVKHFFPNSPIVDPAERQKLAEEEAKLKELEKQYWIEVEKHKEEEKKFKEREAEFKREHNLQ